MRRLLTVLLLVSGGQALAVDTVTCTHCTGLQSTQFFGASILRDLHGPGVISSSNSNHTSIFVNVPSLNRTSLVQISRGTDITYAWGIPIIVTNNDDWKIRATWTDDNLSTIILYIPNSGMGAVQEAFMEEEDEHNGEENIPVSEFNDLPGFDVNAIWNLVYQGSTGIVSGINVSGWSFNVSGPLPTPIVTVVECAYHSGC